MSSVIEQIEDVAREAYVNGVQPTTVLLPKHLNKILSEENFGKTLFLYGYHDINNTPNLVNSIWSSVGRLEVRIHNKSHIELLDAAGRKFIEDIMFEKIMLGRDE